jgi:chromosome segregation ATPase
MKTLEQQKESVDTQFAKWESRINSIEKSFEEKSKETTDWLHEKKEKLLTTMDKIDSRVNDLVNLSEEKKNKILEKRDTLKVQLTLGKAEIKTNFKENIKLYNDAIRDYEEQLVSDLEIEDALLEKEWIEDSIAYEEEMNALAIELAKEDEKEWEKFEQKRGEFKESLRAFKAKVEEKNKKFKDGLEESFEDVAEHYGELGQYYYMY